MSTRMGVGVSHGRRGDPAGTSSRDAAAGRTPSFTGTTVARILGMLILVGWLTYGPGSLLIESVTAAPNYPENVAHQSVIVVVGAVLMLLNSAAVIAIGVLWFPILRVHSERVALGYFSVRVFEALALAVGVIGLLSLARLERRDVASGAADAAHLEPLAAVASSVNDVSYQVGMAGLGLGSLFFCYLLYRTQLVPRPLAAWGFVGYGVFAAGAVCEMFGVEIGMLLTIPGGLFELFFATWLIVKGLDPRALPS